MLGQIGSGPAPIGLPKLKPPVTTPAPNPSSTPTPPPGGGVANPNPYINLPGQQPSGQQYQNWITQDPTYMAMLNAINGNEAAASAAMRGNIQKEVMQYGYSDPAWSQYLDPGMQDQASHNPYSLANQALQGHQTNMRQIQNALAARGAYNSGELSYGLGQEGQRYAEQDLANRSQLSDFIGNLLNNMAGMKSQDAIQIAQALGQATQNQYALHPGTPGETANWDSSTGTYVDSKGNHYDAKGDLVGGTGSPQTYTGGVPGAVNPPKQKFLGGIPGLFS